MKNDRYIQFDGVTNFRDVGGLFTIDGKQMKTSVLYRSDELSKLSDDDLVRFDLLNIKTICDLRTPSERKSRLDRLPVKCIINVVNIPLSDQHRNVSPFRFFIHMAFSSDKINFEKFITDHYYRNAFERTAQIKQILTLIVENNDAPTLIHCTVGKDRTGLISAIIQILCGVSRKDVIDDYLLTNHFIEKRCKKLTRYIRFMSLYRISAAQLKPLLEARAEYLDTILSLILNKYNTIDNYLIKACGLDTETINKLKFMFLR